MFKQALKDLYTRPIDKLLVGLVYYLLNPASSDIRSILMQISAA